MHNQTIESETFPNEITVMIELFKTTTGFPFKMALVNFQCKFLDIIKVCLLQESVLLLMLNLHTYIVNSHRSIFLWGKFWSNSKVDLIFPDN